MNHPKPEEWVPYLYGEATIVARKELSGHLRNCAQCREEVERWRRNIKRLDTWKLPRVRRRHPELLAPFLKWAAAAAIMLAAGIWVGRATAPKIDMDKVRVALLPELRRDLRRETAPLVQQEVARAASLTLASSQRYSERLSQQVYGVLKKDLDTVALNAAAGLRTTEEQLVQLADYNPPQIPRIPNP